MGEATLSRTNVIPIPILMAMVSQIRKMPSQTIQMNGQTQMAMVWAITKT